MSETDEERIAASKAWRYQRAQEVIDRNNRLADGVVRDATSEEVAASIIPVAVREGTHDSEEAAIGWNQGYDEAVSQQLQDNPALFAVALRAAADRLADDPAQAKLDRTTPAPADLDDLRSAAAQLSERGLDSESIAVMAAVGFLERFPTHKEVSEAISLAWGGWKNGGPHRGHLADAQADAVLALLHGAQS